MKKVIIIVDDKVFSISKLLFNVQSALFISAINNLNNAPIEDDTEICVLNVLWDQQSDKYCEDESNDFKSYKEKLQKCECNMRADYINIPRLNYTYDFIKLEKKEYIENSIECNNKLVKKIEEIRKNRDCVLLLDVVLNDENDINIVLNNDSDSKILTELLYPKYSDCCIPYTNYDEGGIKFRDRWAKNVGLEKEVYERKSICGNYLNKFFIDNIYKILKIGSVTNE